MDTWVCLNCDEESAIEEFPFGDDLVCPRCGAVHRTDWDYTNYDSMAFWVVGLRKDD